jgi:hypothetical protein
MKNSNVTACPPERAVGCLHVNMQSLLFFMLSSRKAVSVCNIKRGGVSNITKCKAEFIVVQNERTIFNLVKVKVTKATP